MNERRRALLASLALALGLLAGPGPSGCSLLRGDPFEIHIVGGSTAYGEPYGPDLNVGAIASYLLGGRIGDRPIVVVNHAMRGAASSQVLQSIDDVPSHAGVVFLYSGHNEFLDVDKPGDLSKRERELIDRDPLLPARREAILGQYERNIAEIIETLKRRDIPLILSTVTSNLSDFEPNRSTIQDPRNRDRVATLAATEAWAAILELEPGFAWAQMELANLLRASGNHEEARRRYRLAADLDALPNRALSSQNEALRGFAREHRVPLVDAAVAFEQASSNGLVGDELMWDNCHPTLEGYTLLARLLAGEIAELLGAPPPTSDGSREAIESFFGIDAERRQEILHSRGRYLYGLATRVWDPSRRLMRARAYLDAAGEIRTDAHVLSSLAVLSALEDQPTQSGILWRQALELDTYRTKRRFHHPRVQQIMGRSPELRAELARLREEMGPRRWYDRFL